MIWCVERSLTVLFGNSRRFLVDLKSFQVCEDMMKGLSSSSLATYEIKSMKARFWMCEVCEVLEVTTESSWEIKFNRKTIWFGFSNRGQRRQNKIKIHKFWVDFLRRSPWTRFFCFKIRANFIKNQLFHVVLTEQHCRFTILRLAMSFGLLNKPSLSELKLLSRAECEESTQSASKGVVC